MRQRLYKLKDFDLNEAYVKLSRDHRRVECVQETEKHQLRVYVRGHRYRVLISPPNTVQITYISSSEMEEIIGILTDALGEMAFEREIPLSTKELSEELKRSEAKNDKLMFFMDRMLKAKSFGQFLEAKYLAEILEMFDWGEVKVCDLEVEPISYEGIHYSTRAS